MFRRYISLGFLPLPWFLFFTALGGVFSPGYRSLTQHASELLAIGGVQATLFRVAVVGSGIAFCGFGLAVWSFSKLNFSIASISWIAFGCSMISNAIWPMGHPMHGLYALGVINLLAPALTHIELSELNDQHICMTAIISILGIFYLWLNLTGFDPSGVRGLTQRVFYSLFALWPFLVSKHFHSLKQSNA